MDGGGGRKGVAPNRSCLEVIPPLFIMAWGWCGLCCPDVFETWRLEVLICCWEPTGKWFDDGWRLPIGIISAPELNPEIPGFCNAAIATGLEPIWSIWRIPAWMFAHSLSRPNKSVNAPEVPPPKEAPTAAAPCILCMDCGWRGLPSGNEAAECCCVAPPTFEGWCGGSNKFSWNDFK